MPIPVPWIRNGQPGIPLNLSSGTKLRSALDEARQRIEAYEDLLEPMNLNRNRWKCDVVFWLFLFN